MEQIIGHGKVLSLLSNSLRTERLSHAYLLVGPAKVGKMTVALWLARAVNCEAVGRPCDRCVHCQKISARKHSDVQIIGLPENVGSGADSSQTEISIDQIKDVQHIASLPPFEGKHKVFIIDGAERLSTEAANCLLKTLEEPVGRVLFILLTSAEGRLLPTVVSRCQRLELVPLPRSEIETALSSRGVEVGKAVLLSRLSHGCPGWAITATQNTSLLEERQREVSLITDIIRAGYEERFAYAAQLATQFGKSREATQDVLNLWLDWWRDILLVKTGCDGSITNVDRADSLTEMSRAFNLVQLRTFIDRLQRAVVHLRENANARLVLEELMLNIPEIENG